VTPPGSGSDPFGADEDPALGAPVTELRHVSVGVGDRFATRVRGRIERRALAGDALELAWTAPLTMLLEFLRLPFDLWQGRRQSPRDKP
jgi:hypothetical protein